MYKLAIFDLDGTILDTLADLAAATNYALRAQGLSERALDEVRAFVGNGIHNLIVRAVCASSGVAVVERFSASVLVCSPADESLIPLIERTYASFTAYYRDHCADSTCAYDGIVALLQALRAHGIKTAVVSNKADYGVQELCAKYFPALFDYACGERDGIQRKPAPDSVFHVMERLHAEAKDTVYIGDSDVDIATAKNAGLHCISVLWGFRTKAFLCEHGAMQLVETPHELQTVLLED